LFRPELIYYDGQYITSQGVASAAVSADFISSRFNSGAGTSADLRCQLFLNLKLVGNSGTTYYLNMTELANGSAQVWDTTLANVGFPTIFTGNNYQDWFNSPQAPDPRSGSSIGGTHAAIPDSGELFIEGYSRFRWLQTPFSSSLEIDNVDPLFPNQTGSVIKGLAMGMTKPDGNTYYLRYLLNGNNTTQQLVSASQGTAISNSILELDPVNLGSGPTAQTPTRIKTFDAAGNGDDGTNITWQVYQETTGDGETGSITKILCKEILSGRKSGVDVYNGSIQTDTTTNYEFHLSYDNIFGSKVYVPNEMTYSANEGIWDGQWIETDLDASGQGYSLTDILADENQTATLTDDDW
jgi:hypothetical protein